MEIANIGQLVAVLCAHVAPGAGTTTLGIFDEAFAQLLQGAEDLHALLQVVGAFSQTASNFSGYSLARMVRPAAAKPIPMPRRPVRMSTAPAPMLPNINVFFQVCMFTSKDMRLSRNCH